MKAFHSILQYQARVKQFCSYTYQHYMNMQVEHHAAVVKHYLENEGAHTQIYDDGYVYKKLLGHISASGMNFYIYMYKMCLEIYGELFPNPKLFDLLELPILCKYLVQLQSA